MLKIFQTIIIKFLWHSQDVCLHYDRQCRCCCHHRVPTNSKQFARHRNGKKGIEVDFKHFLSYNHLTVKLLVYNVCVSSASSFPWSATEKFDEGNEYFLRRWLTNKIRKQSSSNSGNANKEKGKEKEQTTEKMHTNADIECIWFFSLSLHSVRFRWLLVQCMDILSFWWNRICRARLRFFFFSPVCMFQAYICVFSP